MSIKKATTLTLSLFLIQGCKTVEPDNHNIYQSIPLTKAFMTHDSFTKLNRRHFYPQQRAIKRTEGCATVEYVVSTENKILKADVIASSHKDFSKASIKAIKQWPWDKVPSNSLFETIKTRNTFYYCIDDSRTIKQCAQEKFDNICPRSSRIDTVSSRVRGR